MKLWFIEPRPNIFVSGIKDSVAITVIDYLYKHCPPESGIVIFRSLPGPTGYEVRSIGPTRKPMTIISGDRKSTRLNSSHVRISYAVFCLKKKNKIISYHYNI